MSLSSIETKPISLSSLKGSIKPNDGEELSLLASSVSEGCIVEIGAGAGKATAYLAEGASKSGRANAPLVHVIGGNSKLDLQLRRVNLRGGVVPHRSGNRICSIGFLFLNSDTRNAPAILRAWQSHLLSDALIVADGISRKRLALLKDLESHARETNRSFETIGRLGILRPTSVKLPA
jgi:predicted O-methyltransferase YrrM